MGGKAEKSLGGHFITPLLGKPDGGSHVSTASRATSAHDTDNDLWIALLCDGDAPAEDWRKRRDAHLDGPDAVRQPAQSAFYPQAYWQQVNEVLNISSRKLDQYRYSSFCICAWVHARSM